jgi:hypothetical protein
MAYAGVDYNLSSPYVHSRVDSNTFTMGNPMSESTFTYAGVYFSPVRGFGFGLWKCLQEPYIYVLYTLSLQYT